MSPYENLLRQEDYHRVGLCALVKTGLEVALQEAIKPSTLKAPQNFRNIHVFWGQLDGCSCIFVYLETAEGNIEDIPGQMRRSQVHALLAPFLSPHPRAGSAGSPWIRMELINVIGPTRPTVPQQIQHLGYASYLKPESELTYRTLHQTNWPGVVDQMGRSHYRCWITFLIEIADDLTLFTYCEYVGQNRTTDDNAMASDPTTQRWWKHTQPCLHAPGGFRKSWLPLAELLTAGAPATRLDPAS